jgi:hypothetical protein
VWTGVGAAAVCATAGIVAVAICWLPVSGSTGRVHSTIHAGLLTFLASLHGGATVDGEGGNFLPLGMLFIVAATAWRAGAGLADAAAAIDETDPVRLARAALAQAVSFAVACLVAAPFATLGTSSVGVLGIAVAAPLVFLLAGGGALACYSPLSDWLVERVPQPARHAGRAAGAALAVYVAAGALLVAAALVLHHGRVVELTRQVGGGWGGVPILLLGILAAPNAVIAGMAYLAGPGFAVGSGTTVSAFSTAHGTMPAFPILGAVPSGDGATPLVWALVALTPLVGGLVMARLIATADGWRSRLRVLGAALGMLAVALGILGWQGGGSIGRLSAVGASPWQLAVAVPIAVGTVAAAALGVAAVRESRTGEATAPRPVGALARRLSLLTDGAAESSDADAGDGPGSDAESGDQLAG